MAVPKTKKELINQSHDNYNRMIELIESFSEEEKLSEFPPGTLNRNIKDVLAHLHQWHVMFIQWYKVGMQGKKPVMPAEGYTWRETKELNRKIWETYQNHDFMKIIDLLGKTHSELHDIINKHDNQELFEKKRYHWTGSSSLATYIRSNTSSHYNWAYNLIKKAKKQ